MKFVSGEFVSSSVSRIPVSAASSELALSGFKVLKRRRKTGESLSKFFYGAFRC